MSQELPPVSPPHSALTLRLWPASLGIVFNGVAAVLRHEPSSAPKRRWSVAPRTGRRPSRSPLRSQRSAACWCFGLASIWLFGREFSQNTVTDLLALPTARTTIVLAKFVVATGWCLALAVQLLVRGLLIGTVLGLPGWSTGLVLAGTGEIAATAMMTMLLTTPIAFAASVGRGYLPGVGVLMAAVFFAQVVAARGYGRFSRGRYRRCSPG